MTRKRKTHHRPRESTTERKGSRKAKRRVDASPTVQGAHVLLLVLAFAGLALTAYLTAVKWFGSVPLACSEGSECDLVQSSRWSTLLGLPIAFWGFLTYAALVGAIWRLRRRRRTWRVAWVVAFIGVGISVYLTAISLFVIEATCVYCLSSFGLVAAILAILSITKPKPLPDFQWRTWLPGTAVATVMLVAGLQLHYSGVFDPGAGPEKAYLRALAVHLQESGARFYGAYWCPRCQDQKALFEASAHRLPYVECTPGGRNGPRSVSCLTKNIRRYPTWVIDGQHYESLLEPETLARYSEFRWEGDKASGS